MTGPVMLLGPHAAGPHDERWHQLRREGIGASEIPAVLGLSPYDSPFSLYWRKAEGWVDPETPEQRRGRKLEAVVADEWAEEHPEWSVWPGGLYRHPVRDWMLATPDRILTRADGDGLCCDTHRVPCCDPEDCGPCCPDCPTCPQLATADRLPDALLQIKTTGTWDGWGDEGTAHVPVHYAAQCLWELAVMGLDVCYLAVLHPTSWEIRTYPIRYDADDVAVMVHAGKQFMDRLAAGDPPDVDWTAATTAALKRLHPTLVEGDVEIPWELRDRYIRAKQLVKRAEALATSAENEIRARLGDHASATCDGEKVATRTVYERKPYQVGPATVDRLTPARRKKD